MGSSTNTSKSSTTSNSPQLTSTANNLLKGVDAAWKKGPQVFDQSLYAGVGGTTKDAWSQALKSAQNPVFSNSVNGALQSFGDVAAGKAFGMNDPGYATLRQNAANDALQSIGQSFGNSGLFGGSAYLNSAGEGVTNALAGLDYQNYQSDIARQQQAAGMLPGLFSASQLPASVASAVGSAQDADKQAALQGKYDLQQRQANGSTDLLAKLSSILAGNSAAVGSTTTTSTPGTPLWQTLLGLGVQAL